MRIGLLLPSSGFYPYIGSDFFEALKMALSVNVEFYDEDVETASPEIVQKAVRNLIVKKNVDMIAGWIGYKSIMAIRPIIQQTQTPLIMCNSGEIPLLKADQSPYIIHLSLNLFESVYYVAKWAFQTFGRNYVNQVSFFDAGYPFLFAADLASKNYKGNILGVDVSHQNNLGLKYENLIKLSPDFMFSSYSGWEAVDFMKLLREKNNTANLPIISHAMFSDEVVLKNEAAENVYFVKTWKDLQNTSLNKINEDFHSITHRKISPFGIIGFETGAIINHLIDKGWKPKFEIQDKVEGAKIKGPRGEIYFENNLNRFNTNYFLYQTKRNKSNVNSEFVKQLFPEESDLEILTTVDKEVKGWTNTYLCI